MGEEDFEQTLIEYAEDEASEIATCLIKFRQRAPSCNLCRFSEFCDYLAIHLAELEAEG